GGMRGPAQATVRGRRGRLPGLVNVGAAVAVLALILQLALRASQAATPAIAEFAPQAQRPIQSAVAEQAGNFGAGAGGAGAGATPPPSPSATQPQDVVFRHCVGDPPRQIEDPQSPPCVPFWRGNNGGGTSKGVGRNVIKIFVPNPSASVSGHSGDDGTEG